MRKIRLSNRLWEIIELSPVLLATGVLSFGAVSVFLLLLGKLDTAFVLPLGLLAVFISSKLVLKYGASALRKLPGTIQERRIVGVLALVLAAGWTLFNAAYSSQNIYVYRDPAIYNVTAEWIVKHDSLVIPGSDVFGDNPNIVPDTASFGTLPETGDRLYAQAPHLLPVLLGLIGRLGGSSLMLHSNAIFGGLALLAVFAVARLFMRPRWALIVTSILAISLPMIYFTRDTYSEPLTLMLIFNALSLVWLAQRTKRRAIWLLAGFAAGSSVLTRIDAYLVVAAFLVFTMVTLALSVKAERLRRLMDYAWFSAGMAAVAVLGYLDLKVLSARYLHDLHSEFFGQIAVIAAVLVAGVIGTAIIWKWSNFDGVVKKMKPWLPFVGIGLVVLFSLFLASRPLWYQGHDSFDNPLVRLIQKNEQSAIDGTRSYSEYTLYWIAWYTGPILLLFSLVGLAIVIYRVLRLDKKSYIEYVPLLLVVALTSLLYFNLPKITPDQIWASRRFLPIVFPGFAIFAGIGLELLSDRVMKYKKMLMTGIVALAFALPLFISYPFLRVRINVPELAQINQVCDTLPRNAAALLIGQNAFNMTQTVKTYCDVPAERIEDPSIEDIRNAASSAIKEGYIPYVIVVDSEKSILGKSAKDLSLVSTVTYKEVERRLQHPPRETVTTTQAVLMAKITDDGRLEGVR